MRSMRKLLAVVTTALLVAALAGPALADKPVTFTDSVTFPDDNPCTEGFDPNEHEVTINFVVSVHEHRNTFVLHSRRSGSTSSGFTMINGTESFVVNQNVERGAFMDQWRHPDGSKFVAQGHFLFNLNTGELVVERVSFRCLGNN